jgi:phosphatidylinositol-3-phosphatase
MTDSARRTIRKAQAAGKLGLPVWLSGLVVSAAVTIFSCAIAACGAVSTQSPSQPRVPQSSHVVMVMEENHSYNAVVGSANWPHLNHLISQGALPANYYANVHPSMGNYLMLVTGHVLTTNDGSTKIWNVDNLARRMLDAGETFRVYAQDIPRGYLGRKRGAYVSIINPFVRLSDVADNPGVANQCIWPFTQFASDLNSNALPDFSYVLPDLNNDAHNGSSQKADAWLETNVIVPLSSGPAFQPGGDGILIVLFDESVDTDTTHGGGHIAPVFWGPNVKVGYTQKSTTRYQHQSMLRTVLQALQLSDNLGAASAAPSMGEFFVQK